MTSSRNITILVSEAKRLSGAPLRRIRLEGNTDARGSAEYNIGLGLRRAQAVKQVLELNGARDSEIETVSYGAERPAVAENAEFRVGAKPPRGPHLQRTLNRRIAPGPLAAGGHVAPSQSHEQSPSLDTHQPSYRRRMPRYSTLEIASRTLHASGLAARRGLSAGAKRGTASPRSPSSGPRGAQISVATGSQPLRASTGTQRFSLGHDTHQRHWPPNFNLWVPDDRIAHRIVVSIDALGRHSLPIEQRLIRHVHGDYLVRGDDTDSVAADVNAARYAPLLKLLRVLDMPALVRIYSEFYPLFQQEYKNTGYPDMYFNDRVVEVIDLLLATPEPSVRPHLKRPGVMYVYSDADLEGLAAGQKILLRVGPDNEAAVKGRLRELRALLVSKTVAAPASTALP